MFEPTTPIPDPAIMAAISDGDFRTFALICHLAWRTHPQAERPYTELGYDELAKLHSGSLTGAAIRARIQRLIQAGLLVRQRLDNVRWRTFPLLADLTTNDVGVICDSPHVGDGSLSATPANTQVNAQQEWVLPQIAPNDGNAKVGVMGDLTHVTGDELSAMPASTQVEPLDGWVLPQITPTGDLAKLGATGDNTQANENDLGAMPDHTQQPNANGWVRSQVTPTQTTGWLSATTDHTQVTGGELGATPANTHVTEQSGWVLSPITPNSENLKVGAMTDSTQRGQELMGGMAANTQTGKVVLGAMVDHTQAARSELGATVDHTQPSDLTDLTDDLIDHDQINQSDQSSQAGEGQTQLVAALMALQPEPMSEQGLVECLRQPALTAAWLNYVHDPANGVQNPAAYLRRQVRRGKYPPLQPVPTHVPMNERRVDERNRGVLVAHAAGYERGASPPALTASLALVTPAPTRWPLDAG